MVVAKQEMHLSAQNDLLAALHAVRNQVQGAESGKIQPGAYPARKERKRKRVSCRDRQALTILLTHRPGIPSRFLQTARDFGCQRQEMGTRFGQRDALWATREKPGANPILKTANAPAESWLRHVSCVSGARKAFQFRQSQKIFEPVEVHADAVCA
jgi:hypothetical protein